MKKKKCHFCASTDVTNYHSSGEILVCTIHASILSCTSVNDEGSSVPCVGTNRGIIRSSRTWGVELECHAPSRLNLQAGNFLLPEGWGSGSDGTINHAFSREIRTVPMSGKRYETVFSDYCRVLADELGYGLTPTCGTHVHIGMPEFSGNMDDQTSMRLRNLVVMYTVFEPAIRCLLPSERRDGQWCHAMGGKHVGIDREKDELSEFHKKAKSFENVASRTLTKVQNNRTFTKYYGINFSSLYERRTLEIRYHEGTLDPERVIHWIALHSAIVDLCMDGDVGEDDIMKFAKMRNVEDLLGSLLFILGKRLEMSTREYTVKRFEKYRHLNPMDGHIGETRFDPNNPPAFEHVEFVGFQWSMTYGGTGGN